MLFKSAYNYRSYAPTCYYVLFNVVFYTTIYNYANNMGFLVFYEPIVPEIKTILFYSILHA